MPLPPVLHLHPPMWLVDFILTPSPLQAVTIISAICALGLSLAKFRLRGLTLGTTFVFFSGIAAGALGLQIDGQMLSYAQSFGLVLFIYALGMQVGPGFFSAFRSGGGVLNALGIAILVLGTVMTLGIILMGWMPIADAMGVLCGATTNTPALGAAQQTLHDLQQPDAVAALACAVTYPVGTVGVIIVIALMKRWLTAHDHSVENEPKKQATVFSFHVKNPAICGKTLHDVATQSHIPFVVSRLWRNGETLMPAADTTLQNEDRILVITEKTHVEQLTIYFGQLDETDWNKADIDWNSLDKNLVAQRIVITRPEINGRLISSLHFRERYGVTVTRVKRTGLQFVATPNLRLRLGDRINVVGTEKGIANVSKEVGNVVKNLDDPNLVAIFVGIFLGLILGSLPIEVGLDYPLRLGLAGGSVIMGILIGSYGPQLHMVSYTTTSANLMLRSLGLTTYLACLGLSSGSEFIATVMQPAALWWILAAFLICTIPVTLIAVLAVTRYRQSPESTAGMLCGAMANPIALGYVNDNMPGDKASVAYVTVYPLAMFLRVIVAQVMVMWFFA